MPNSKQKHFFGHIFHVAGEAFLYDVSCQELIVLEPILAEVLPCFEECRDENIPNHLQSRYKHSDIEKTVQVIDKGRREEGLFLATRPRLIPATAPSELAGQYATQLQHLVLTLTESCNLRCRYCVYGANLGWVRSHGHQTMSLQTAWQATQYFLERCTTKDTPTISFYGGESLLQIDLIRAVAEEVRNYPGGQNAHLVIDTNGVLLEDAIIDLVLDHKMNLQISLDGPKPVHDRQRLDAQGQGTFDRIMKGLDKLLDRDPLMHQRLSFVCTVAPPVDLMEVDSFFAELPPYVRHGLKAMPELRVNLANLKGQKWPATAADFTGFGEQMGQLRKVYFEAIALGKRENLGPVVKALVEPGLLRLHHRSRSSLGETYTPGGNCRPGIRKLHVTVDGHLQPCERTGDSLQLGCIDSGLDTWAVEKIQEGFFAAVESNCADCWALRLCRVCFAGWSEQGGFGSKVPESECQKVRRGIEKDLQLLVQILELPPEKRSFMEKVEIL